MGGRLSTDTDTPAPPAPPAPPARVVVVGASFAGLALTRQLLASGAPCDVTVVEPKDYFEYTPGVLRCFVAPEKAEGLLVPLPKTFGPKGRVTWVRGWLSHVEEGKVIVAPHPQQAQSPIEIGYDHLVLCTGSGYPAPIKAPHAAAAGGGSGSDAALLSRAHRVEALTAEARKVTRAPNVLILGGGTVGVELAAEIAWRFGKGNKQIVLVSRTPVLLPTLPAACGRAAQRWLQSRGVTVLLGDEVVEDSQTTPLVGGTFIQQGHGGELRTRNGVRLVATAASKEEGWLVYRCTGPTPTAPAYLPSGGVEASATGWLLTDGRLRARARRWRQRLKQEKQQGQEGVGVSGDTDKADTTLGPLVLAVGDCVDGSTGDDRTAFAAELQGEAAATQILAAIRRAREGGPDDEADDVQGHHYPVSLVGDARSPLIYCLSLGPYEGVLVFNELVLAGPVLGRVAALMKCFIEVTKLWEASGVAVARLFWVGVAHPLTFFLHRRFFKRRPKMD